LVVPDDSGGGPSLVVVVCKCGWKVYGVLDPLTPHLEPPRARVTAAKELLQWVLGVVFKEQLTIEDMEYLPRTVYTYPQQDDGYSCGIYVGLYMVMIARSLLNYSWPVMWNFRYKLALAIEKDDVNVFLPPQMNP